MLITEEILFSVYMFEMKLFYDFIYIWGTLVHTLLQRLEIKRKQIKVAVLFSKLAVAYRPMLMIAIRVCGSCLQIVFSFFSYMEMKPRLRANLFDMSWN